ncbi:hypothetical protein M422DRAFT_785707 [Sphaerobolus stellatus SS14]|uniref:Uncharacterized protein n=1 Tax=Sphaerobolus stellatus (strain SS14) TaxID=990650 RepID=A0A0C9UI70_SPHS4|nr:hypothetical protein M422DRAFT_785707 [Sphaerobolus stellatus SS14]
MAARTEFRNCSLVSKPKALPQWKNFIQLFLLSPYLSAHDIPDKPLRGTYNKLNGDRPLAAPRMVDFVCRPPGWGGSPNGDGGGIGFSQWRRWRGITQCCEGDHPPCSPYFSIEPLLTGLEGKINCLSAWAMLHDPEYELNHDQRDYLVGVIMDRIIQLAQHASHAGSPDVYIRKQSPEGTAGRSYESKIGS